MAWASLALAAIVAKAGADSVIAQVTPSGQYRTSTVYGPEQIVKLTLPTGTFNAWTQASRLFGDLWVWLSVQAVGELFFVTGYVGLSAALIRNTMGPVASGGLSGWLGRWGLLAALAVVNVVQVVLSIAAFAVWIRPHDYVPYTLVWWLTAVVLVKWPLAIIFVTVMAYRLADSREARQQLKRIAFALNEQRFSLVIVALLGVIAIARGSDVLEQMPDVQRAWLTWPPSRSWSQLGFALAVQALLAVLLALLSAMRTQRARDAARREDYRADFSRWPWARMAVAVPIVALAMSHFGDATVSWYNVLPIPVLAGIVFFTSWLKPTPRDPVKAPDCASDGPGCACNQERAEAEREQRQRVRTVRTTGDMVAVAVIALTGLGLVRSFTAAAMVVGPPYRWIFMIAVAVGGVVAVYLGNSPQPEPGSGAPPGAPSQMLIPVASSASAAHAQLDGSTALLQQVSAATADWMACAAPGKTAPGKIADYEAAVYHRCMQDQAAAATRVPQQLIMVVPREYPAVAAPLGWVLSAASQGALTGGVATEAASTCPKPEQYCPPHVGRLGDLLHLVSHTPSK